MHLSSFDVCVPGFERLRSQDEFILATVITAEMKPTDIRMALRDDLSCCAREDNFDYAAARRIIKEFTDDLKPNNPFNLDATPEFDENESECCYLFLYITE